MIGKFFYTLTVNLHFKKSHEVNMTDFSKLAASLENVMNIDERIVNALERIDILEGEVKILRQIAKESWVTLERAADEIGKSPSAVRQMIKNPKKMMAKGTVWKQKDKGASIYINLKAFREKM